MGIDASAVLSDEDDRQMALAAADAPCCKRWFEAYLSSRDRQAQSQQREGSDSGGGSAETKTAASSAEQSFSGEELQDHERECCCVRHAQRTHSLLNPPSVVGSAVFVPPLPTISATTAMALRSSIRPAASASQQSAPDLPSSSGVFGGKEKEDAKELDSQLPAWRSWLAVRDECAAGVEAGPYVPGRHPHRFSERQLVYHYTKDRSVLKRELELRRAD